MLRSPPRRRLPSKALKKPQIYWDEVLNQYIPFTFLAPVYLDCPYHFMCSENRMGFTYRYVSTSCKLRQISVIHQRPPLNNIKMSCESVGEVLKKRSSELIITRNEFYFSYQLMINWTTLHATSTYEVKTKPFNTKGSRLILISGTRYRMSDVLATCSIYSRTDAL